MRVLIITSLILGFFVPQLVQANNSPTEVAAIISAFKAGESIIDKKVMLDGVDFASLESELTIASQSQLKQLATILKTIPTVTFEIISHTDKQSQKTAGQKLTRSRAKNVSDFLILKGIPYQRIFYTGIGDKEPISKDKKEAGRALNNRIELRFTGLKSGNHQIVTTTGEPVTAQVLIIDNDQIYYRNERSSRNQTIPLAEVQRVDMTFGKPIEFNNQPAKNIAQTNEYHEEAIVEFPPTANKTNPMPSEPARLSRSNTTPPTKKISPPFTKNQRNKVSSPEPVVTEPVVTNQSNDIPPAILKEITEPIPATEKQEEKEPSTPIASNPNASRVGTTTTKADKVETPTPQPRPTIPTPSSPTSKPIDVTAENNVGLPATLEEGAILSLYLDNYLLQPKVRPKEDPTSEELFNLNNSGSQLNTAIAGGAGNVNSLTGASSSGKGVNSPLPSSVVESRGGLTVQVIRLPLGVAAANLRLNYVDNSALAVRVEEQKSLPEINSLMMGSIGFIYHSYHQMSYHANYNFGNKEGFKYNSIGIGAAYRLQKGRIKLLPGAQLEYGSGNFSLGSHELRTNIFTVKKTEFVGEKIAISYRENTTTITPQLGITYPVSSKFDLLLNGGYSVNLLSISKLRFTGATEKKENKMVREKLDAADFSIDGVQIVESAKLFGLQGLAFKAGIIWKFY